jgi:L-histidine N-alpha-methyltransferase
MQLIDLEPPREDFRTEVLGSLCKKPKRLSSKFFYDEQGSKLFEEICGLEEYYPTRSELRILERHADELVNILGPRCFLFEFGSGAGQKIRLLLDRMEYPEAYAPVDISREMLMTSSQELVRDYPGLRIVPIVADFTRKLAVPAALSAGCESKAVFFPGSTIGNFDPDAAAVFFDDVAELLGPRGLLVIGVDLFKDSAVLEPAYNDRKGVTARFNLNVLARINRELQANFNPESFRHLAFFNTRESRIEMHIQSLKSQTVVVDGRSITFDSGETIHTENSYKYSPVAFEQLAGRAGFRKLKLWTDARGYFGVYVFECGKRA